VRSKRKRRKQRPILEDLNEHQWRTWEREGESVAPALDWLTSANRNLEFMQRAFEAGNPFGLVDAVIYCAKTKHVSLSLPAWALQALAQEILAGLRGQKRKRMGRHSSIRREHIERQIDFCRYEAVQSCREHGYSYKDYEEAAKCYMAQGYSSNTAWKKARTDNRLIPLRTDQNSGGLEKDEKRHSLDAAFENAVTILEGLPAGGKIDAIRSSWRRVKKNIRHPGYYYLSMYSRYFVPDFLKK
jgi:hypothetical protein